MIPRGSRALGDLAMKLAMSIAPETSSTYAAANTMLVSSLMQCLALDYDRAAEVRMQDIGELREIFGDAVLHAPADVARRIRSFLSAEPKSLRISDIDALHAQGLEILIDLHAHAEDAGDTALDRRIWEFLERHADRHAFAG